MSSAEKEAAYHEQLRQLQEQLDEADEQREAIIGTNHSLPLTLLNHVIPISNRGLAKSKEMVQRVRDSTREEVEEESHTQLIATVKKAMSAVYNTMSQKLDDERRYYGGKITQTLLTTIKQQTLKVCE